MHFTLMLQNSQALMWNVRMMHKVCAGIAWARRKKYDSAMSKLANTEANKLAWPLCQHLQRFPSLSRLIQEATPGNNPFKVRSKVCVFCSYNHDLWRTLRMSANHKTCKLPPRIMDLRKDSDGVRVEVSPVTTSGVDITPAAKVTVR